MNKNVLDNICFYDVETTGIPSKGAKWDEDLNFLILCSIAWVINAKKEALLYILNFGIFRKNQSQYMVLLSLKL